MRELTFVAKDRLEFRERPEPRISSGVQALVRPLAVSRCDLDLSLVNGTVPVETPFALGHECIAEVLNVGDAVKTVKPGDRVVVPFQISCGACARCLAGHTGSCTAVPKRAAFGLAPLSGSEFGGAVSDVMLVPYADAMLVPLPKGIDPVAAAALGDNAVDGFRCVYEPLKQLPGASVMVAGGGAQSIGLYAVAAAKALGAKEIVYVDASESRVKLAERLGARGVNEKYSADLRVGRFPITVDASSREEGLRFCLSSTDVWGTCTSVGVYFQDVAFPLLELYTRGIRFLTGRIDARHDLPAALKLASEQRAFDLGTVATRVVEWEQAPLAWLEPETKLVVRR